MEAELLDTGCRCGGERWKEAEGERGNSYRYLVFRWKGKPNATVTHHATRAQILTTYKNPVGTSCGGCLEVVCFAVR